MEAEAAALSQLQLQLLALVSDLRLARERERAAREELHASDQRWKETEEEHRREARELRAEVAARDDALRRLESRVKSLENENELLQRNEKDLKENMERLLQSREAFIKHYKMRSMSSAPCPSQSGINLVMEGDRAAMGTTMAVEPTEGIKDGGVLHPPTPTLGAISRPPLAVPARTTLMSSYVRAGESDARRLGFQPHLQHQCEPPHLHLLGHPTAAIRLFDFRCRFVLATGKSILTGDGLMTNARRRR